MQQRIRNFPKGEKDKVSLGWLYSIGRGGGKGMNVY
jgi:hypothetical protein